MADPVRADDMVTIGEAEQAFGVKRATLYRYIRDGHLTVYRRAMDRHAYVRRSDLEKLRSFRPLKRPMGIDPSFAEAARALQRRVFGDRILMTPSAELIEEARQERTDELP